MHPVLTGFGVVAVASILGFANADAASLRVAPTTVELISPDSAAVFTLRNEARRPLNVQVRVFRWVQRNGEDQLVPTSDVVASPPATQLAPNEDYVVRVVRVAKTPVKAEESYRVIVDELPDPSRRKAGTVNLVVRHKIPVFFRNPDAGAADVSWRVARSGGALVLVARNNGGSRLRISDVTLTQGGSTIASRKGLVGYVLGDTVMKWPIGSAMRLHGSQVKLSAQTGYGPIKVSVAVGR